MSRFRQAHEPRPVPQRSLMRRGSDIAAPPAYRSPTDAFPRTTGGASSIFASSCFLASFSRFADVDLQIAAPWLILALQRATCCSTDARAAARDDQPNRLSHRESMNSLKGANPDRSPWNTPLIRLIKRGALSRLRRVRSPRRLEPTAPVLGLERVGEKIYGRLDHRSISSTDSVAQRAGAVLRIIHTRATFDPAPASLPARTDQVATLCSA
jgi:hypothetical protein